MLKTSVLQGQDDTVSDLFLKAYNTVKIQYTKTINNWRGLCPVKCFSFISSNLIGPHKVIDP